MSNQMWMGIPTKHMQWVPCPLIDSTITRNRNIQRVQFENGGGDMRRSAGYQMEYNLSFNGLAHEVDGIDAFNKFASGFYGDGYVYIAHPAAFETNLFSAGWATPSLVEQGWPKIFDGTFTYVNNSDTSAVEAYNQPSKSVKYVLTSTPNTIPDKRFTIPIPLTHTLHIGASYTATGNAIIAIRPILINNQYDTVGSLNSLPYELSTRMNTIFEGSIYSAVEVFITRTDYSYEESAVIVTSMMAQLHPIGTTPTLTSKHYTGEGSTGLMFADSAIVETYSYMYPPRKGISTVLVEVEAWR
jgi:hypothetical protein